MSEREYFPVILAAAITPNPAGLGAPVLVSVLAEDLAGTPAEQVWRSGEVRSGEV